MIWNALLVNGSLMYGQGNPPSVSGDIIGTWQYEDGNPTEPVIIELYEAIRPLGNDGSEATESLDYLNVLGHALRNLEANRKYPTAKSPFDLEIRHKEFTGTYSGWGWRAEMHGDAGLRDPGVRAIGIYSDVECTQYLYTTGAFVQGTSEWQLDGNGSPLTVWYTECPLGQLQQSKIDWHIALLYASLQEGIQTLPANKNAIRYLFWEHEQGYVPGPSAQWVDTGVTIAQLIGSGVYLCSGIPTITLSQPIRLGDTQAGETVFNGYWPVAGTPSTYITISPHVTASVGATVWKWE